jgi:hypothetical protein
MVLMKFHNAALAALAAAAATAAQSQPLQQRLEGAYERILSKNGVEITGEIDSEYQHAGVEGSAVADTLYSYETTQFTSFDLAMQYRPYDFISARADFRFQQDWQTFFATRSRILTSRWLSMDGNLGNMLGFNVGDYRQRYTPLTLWTPHVDLLQEPLIFARRRAQLMEEQYLEGNDRNLQGINLNFAKRFDSPLSEVRMDAMASRLRRAEFLDALGAHGRGMTRSDMDRFLVAANGEALAMDNLLLGGTFLRASDDRESFEQFLISEASRAEIAAFDPSLLPPDGRSLNGRDSVVARELTVIGGHAGLDVAGFMKNNRLTLDLLADYAQSSESGKYAWNWRRDTTGKLLVDEKSVPGLDGKAMTVELGAGWQGVDSAWGFRLTARYLDNEAAFRNPMAQSPSFNPTRILNTENDFASGALYSTFDALNQGVYKFSPSRRTAAYQQAPYTKSSYGNGVQSVEDLAAYQGDAFVNLLLPFGLATPNRKGASARLQAHWRSAVHLTVDFAQLEQAEGDLIRSVRAAPAAYTQVGAGAKVEIGALMNRELPLDVNMGFTRSGLKRDRTAEDLANPEIASDLIMAGAYYRFLTKWAVLGGFQQASGTSPLRLAGNQSDVDLTNRNWRIGIEYTLTQSAYLMLSGGVNTMEGTSIHRGALPPGTAPATAANPALNRTWDFSQTLAQALINVKF